MWLEKLRRAQEQYYILTKTKLSHKQKKRYLSVKMVKGDIILWMCEPELKFCIVKWENDIHILGS